MALMTDSAVDRVQAFVLERARTPFASRGPSKPFVEDAFWKGLRAVGTELWLDTGDLDGAGKLWNAEFSALTTNNTLLNKEVQKGIYDDVIRQSGALLSGLDAGAKVMEIAFILNALHGLRLVNAFDALVSVELHTATAQDVEAAVAYGKRFARISPDRFIVKVPLTAAGLLATRILRQQGVNVNFTLGFSARQNYLAAGFAFPSYVNVFLGRLNAYVIDNKLGDGAMVGEKSTLASQRAVTELSRRSGKTTRQIAASMRGGSQVRDLAGVDVMTMPLTTAAEARTRLSGKWESRLGEDYSVRLAQGISDKEVRLSVLWDIGPAERSLLESLESTAPKSADELVRRAHELGAGDLFPRMSPQDQKWIADDGKIPKHARWADRIGRKELAVDTLLNLAGLASFTADQLALDDRIRGLIR